MKNSAFTLIELLVVIVIIGILATLTTATFSGSREKADEAKVIAERRDACIESIGACTALGNSDCETFDECMADDVVVTIPASLDPACVAEGQDQWCSNCLATGGLWNSQSSPGCFCAPGYTIHDGGWDASYGACMTDAACASDAGCTPYDFISLYTDVPGWTNWVSSVCSGTMTGGVCLP